MHDNRLPDPDPTGRLVIRGKGLDSDGHLRVTTCGPFILEGGTEDTHARMVERMEEIRHLLAARGLDRDRVARRDLAAIAAVVDRVMTRTPRQD